MGLQLCKMSGTRTEISWQSREPQISPQTHSPTQSPHAPTHLRRVPDTLRLCKMSGRRCKMSGRRYKMSGRRYKISWVCGFARCQVEGQRLHGKAGSPKYHHEHTFSWPWQLRRHCASYKDQDFMAKRSEPLKSCIYIIIYIYIYVYIYMYI